MSHVHILKVLKAAAFAGLVFSSTFSHAFSPREDYITDHDGMRHVPCELFDGRGCREFPSPKEICDSWVFSKHCPFPKPWIYGR